jgi:hypothetical protein
VWLMTGLPACSDNLCGMIGLPVWHSRRTRTGERESQGSPGEAAAALENVVQISTSSRIPQGA